MTSHQIGGHMEFNSMAQAYIALFVIIGVVLCLATARL